MAQRESNLLEVKNLIMYYETERGMVRAVDDVSFVLGKGRTLGIIGESGCGKTSLAFTIMKVLPKNARLIGGQILFQGMDLTKLPRDELNRIRWKKISMIFQSAMNALNPVRRVEDQLVDALRVNATISNETAKKRVKEMFDLVGLSYATMKSYPHELSGGMRQRVVIAMSLLCNPELVIADEPTTALDVTLQDQIIHEIKHLQKELNIAMILITHNIAVVAETCERVDVMYGGKIVESGDVISIFKNSCHPYTRALLSSFPSLRGPMRDFISLPGNPPSLLNPPLGCRFAPRCASSRKICSEQNPPLIKVEEEHYSLCHFARSLDSWEKL
jgi:peptide/nickel transport system ATP-binding protein